MNREIKFRAWDGKQMFLSPSEIQFVGMWFDAHAPGALFKGDVVFMQYTGLKDKNGKEVYEGDVINFGRKYNYKVVFEEAKFVCYHLTKEEWGRWGDLKRLTDPDFSEYHWEVIGNIYQNPGLLPQTATPKE